MLNVPVFVASLPAGAVRVQVTDSRGCVMYRKIADLQQDDTPVLNKSGKPIVMMGVNGAPPKPPVVVNRGLPPSPSPGAPVPSSTVSATQTPDPQTYEPPALALSQIIPAHLMTAEDAATSKVEEVRAIRKRRQSSSAIIRETKKNPGSDLVFDLLMQSMAEESEFLGFERDHLVQNNMSATQVTDQRVRVLKTMADAWLKRRMRTSGAAVDLDSAEFSSVFVFIVETFREAMEDAKVRPELVETILAKLSKRITPDDWKEEAKLRMKERNTGT